MAKKLNYADLYTLRKDGRYQGSWTDAQGARHYAYDRDPAKLHSKIEDAQKPKVLTFGEVAEAWQTAHWAKVTVGTQTAYKAPLEQVVNYHGEFALEDVTASEINRVMLIEQSKDMSYKHAAAVKSMYKQIFTFAIVNGYTLNNPALSVTVPRGLKRSRREAPEDDVIQIIRENVDKPFGLFPMFLLYTGFRAGEACGLQWGDINYKAKTIVCARSVEMHTSKPEIKPPKTDAGYRTVPLLDDLAAVLAKPKGAKANAYVFNNAGALLSRSMLQARWLDWCRTAGLAEPKTVSAKRYGKDCERTVYSPTLTAHQLRHGYCTILFEAGVDELTAMELMGHADIETTRKVYTHLRQKQKGLAADKINAKFAEIKSSDVNGDVNAPV